MITQISSCLCSACLKQAGRAVIWIFVFALVIPAQSAVAMELTNKMELSIGKFKNEKPYFQLNHQPFLPMITYCSLDVEEMNNYQHLGFNTLYVAIDYPWTQSSTEVNRIKLFLNSAAELNIPIIIELQEWDYWKSWLKQHRDCNMVLSNGNFVDTYPDYANPKAKAEHLRRFKTMVEFLAPYFNRPIIAFSLGAYDAYHVPDGEIHIDFVTPPLNKLEQTFLPFGKYSLSAYKRYLQKNRITPKEIGFDSATEIYLPTGRENAQNVRHWTSWIQYRRNYTYTWLKETAKLVRKLSHLPVTVTYDLKFALAERWGTPFLEEADLFDFLMIYYYETANLNLIPQRYKAISEYYLNKKIPFIDMFDAPPPNDDVNTWISLVTPFVSGYLFLPAPEIRREIATGKDFYRFFLNAVESERSTSVWKERSPQGDLAILLSREDIYVTDRLYEILRAPIFLNISYDIVYDLDLTQSSDWLTRYKAIYIPRNQPVLKANKTIMHLLATLNAKTGIPIIEEDHNFQDSVNRLSETFGVRQNLAVFNHLFPLKNLVESSEKNQPAFVEQFMNLNNWNNTITNSTQITKGKLRINKKDKNMFGLRLQQPINGSFGLEFSLTVTSGNPRVTLMLDSTGKGTGEISIGQDEDGQIVLFREGVTYYLAQGNKGDTYRYLVLMAKDSPEQTIFEVQVTGENSKPIVKETFMQNDKRDKEYIYLCWAWPDAEADFKSFKIYQIQGLKK